MWLWGGCGCWPGPRLGHVQVDVIATVSGAVEDRPCLVCSVGLHRQVFVLVSLGSQRLIPLGCLCTLCVRGVGRQQRHERGDVSARIVHGTSWTDDSEVPAGTIAILWWDRPSLFVVCQAGHATTA